MLEFYGFPVVFYTATDAYTITVSRAVIADREYVSDNARGEATPQSALSHLAYTTAACQQFKKQGQ